MQRPSAALIPFISVLAFLMACPILAGPVEDATKAYRRGDLKTAYQLIKPRAEEGDAAAQFFLGFMYDEGQGVPQDYAEAAKWYRRAAIQGNKAAQHNLGLMDHAEAEKWYRRAAEPGNAAAPSNLGLMDDHAETAKWYRRAAEPRNAAAPSNLGLTDDHAETAKWYRGAAEPGNAGAQSNSGLMNHAEAAKWYRRAAE
jgi:TPR repeat protein